MAPSITDPPDDYDVNTLALRALKLLERSRTAGHLADTPEPVATPSRPLRVKWVGAQLSYHSLARINREVCERLARDPRISLSIELTDQEGLTGSDLDQWNETLGPLVAKPNDEADIVVRHYWPPTTTPERHARLVTIQPWEFGGIPIEWVTTFGQHAAEMWVYTSWLQDCYELSGVMRDKTYIVPLAADLKLFSPSGDLYPVPTDKSCRLLFVGGAIERKGIDVLLDAYLREFSADDDVTLVLKSSPRTYPGTSLVERAATARSIPGSPEIVLIEEDLSDAEMAALHRACTALVHPYRGEGFGLPMLESLACGRPVIATNYGAALDFLDDKVAFLIDAEVVFTDPYAAPPSAVGYWCAEPNRVVLGQLMRQLCDDTSLAAARAQVCRERAEQFSWDRTADIVVERLLALAPAHVTASEPYQLDSPRSSVTLLRASDDNPSWRACLVHYLDAVSAADDTTLVVWIQPAIVNSETRMEEVRTLISARRPQYEPDVLIVVENDTDTNTVSLLLAANAVLADVDSPDIELARRLDRTVLTVDHDSASIRKLLELAARP